MSNYETWSQGQVHEVVVSKLSDEDGTSIEARYYVRFRHVTGPASCTCIHGTFNYPAHCKHVPLAKREWLRTDQAITTSQDEPGFPVPELAEEADHLVAAFAAGLRVGRLAR